MTSGAGTTGYTYEAIDGTGQKRRGLETAMSEAVVRAILEARGLSVLAPREANPTAAAAPAPGPTPLAAALAMSSRSPAPSPPSSPPACPSPVRSTPQPRWRAPMWGRPCGRCRPAWSAGRVSQAPWRNTRRSSLRSMSDWSAPASGAGTSRLPSSAWPSSSNATSSSARS